MIQDPAALLLWSLVALPFLGAAAAALLPTNARDLAAALAGGVALTALGLIWAAYPSISSGTVLRTELAWMPQVGLNIVLRMDGLAWLFAGW